MWVHRYENSIMFKIFCMVLSVVVHRKNYNKKINPYERPFQRAGGYRINFLRFLSYEKKAGGY